MLKNLGCRDHPGHPGKITIVAHKMLSLLGSSFTGRVITPTLLSGIYLGSYS